ncbi:MAG: hemolysin family protein [Dehalococcoidia bacterium]
MEHLWQLGLVALLVVINALFAGSELALISLRPGQVERISSRGAGGRAVARLAQDPNRFLATIQVGITLAGFMASAAAAVSLSEPLVPLFEGLGDADEVAAIIVVTLILTFFTLVFGELAPKRIAMQHAEGWALLVARPLDLLAVATRPVVWLLSTSTNVVVRLAGGDPTRRGEEVTEEEIRELVESQATFTPEERRVIAGALEVGERSLREVLVPRHRVLLLQRDMPAPEALAVIAASGHSRIPVYGASADDIVGMVHLRQLIDTRAPVGEVMTPIPAFPESANVLTTLRDLQVERQQMAIVVDEHGGFEGIVTVEDLVEEIVGEIYDEYDRDILSVVRASDGSILLPGRFPVHDLPDLGIDAPDGPFATVAGLLLEELGRIPSVGDSIDLGAWRLRVDSMQRTTITSVRATPAPVEGPAG